MPVFSISVSGIASCGRLIHDFFGSFGPLMVIDVLPFEGTRSSALMLLPKGASTKLAKLS
jgi:hypothetical protein